MKKIILVLAGFLVLSTNQAQKLLQTNFGPVPEMLLESSNAELAIKMKTLLELLSEQIIPKDSNDLVIKSFCALNDPRGITFYLIMETEYSVFGLTFYSNHLANYSWKNANWLKINWRKKIIHMEELPSWNNNFFDDSFYDIGTDGYCDGYENLYDGSGNYLNPKAIKAMKEIFTEKSWWENFDQNKCFETENSKKANQNYIEILKVLFRAYKEYL